MEQYSLVSPITTTHASGSLASVQNSFTRKWKLPTSMASGYGASMQIYLLPLFSANEEQVRTVTVGMKIIAALFKEMEDCRVNLKSAFFLETEVGDALVCRVDYPPPIQVAIRTTLSEMMKSIEPTYPLPPGVWKPYVKLAEGSGLRQLMSGNVPTSFTATIDEQLATPKLLVNKGGRWEDTRLLET